MHDSSKTTSQLPQPNLVESTQPLSPEQPIKTPKPKHFTKLLTLVVILTTALIITVGVTVYFMLIKNQTSDTSNTQLTSTDISQDWQTHTNQEYGYQISFPQDFTVKEEQSYGFDRLSTKTTTIQQNYIPTDNRDVEDGIIIQVSPDEHFGLNLPAYAEKYFFETKATFVVSASEPQNLSINGQNGVVMTEITKSISPTIAPRRYYVIEGPDNLYVLVTVFITGPGSTELSELATKIISTLKFTKTPESSKWQKYADSDLELVFKHSSDDPVILDLDTDQLDSQNKIFIQGSLMFSPSELKKCDDSLTTKPAHCINEDRNGELYSIGEHPAESFEVKLKDSNNSLRVVQLIDGSFSIAYPITEINQHGNFNRTLASLSRLKPPPTCPYYDKILPLPNALKNTSLLFDQNTIFPAPQDPKKFALVQNGTRLQEFSGYCTNLQLQVRGQITSFIEYFPQSPQITNEPYLITKSIKHICWHPFSCQNSENEHVLTVQDTTGNEWWLHTRSIFNRRKNTSPKAEFYTQLVLPNQGGMVPFSPGDYFTKDDGLFLYSD